MLKKSHERWTEEKSKWPLDPIIKDYDKMMSRLARLFIVRHILTHELPMDKIFDKSELDEFFDAAEEFITATQWVVVEILDGSAPRSQQSMNLNAAESMEEREIEMNIIISDIRKIGSIDIDLFDEGQLAWEAYANKQAEFYASPFSGGTMYPLLWASAKREEINRRIETLRQWMENEGSFLQ